MQTKTSDRLVSTKRYMSVQLRIVLFRVQVLRRCGDASCCGALWGAGCPRASCRRRGGASCRGAWAPPCVPVSLRASPCLLRFRNARPGPSGRSMSVCKKPAVGRCGALWGAGAAVYAIQVRVQAHVFFEFFTRVCKTVAFEPVDGKLALRGRRAGSGYERCHVVLGVESPS